MAQTTTNGGEFRYSSLFGELTKNIQLRFDKASELNKQLFDNNIYEQYLTWDAPSVGLNFEEIIGQYNITVAAPTLSDYAAEPITSSEGLKTLSERVLNHAITRPMTAQDYRTALQILDSIQTSDQAKKQKLIDLMWGDVAGVVKSVQARIDYIFLESLFGKGVCSLTNENNPEGGIVGTIDFGQPAENIKNVAAKWDADAIASVDCFNDILNVIDAASDKVTFAKILLPPSLLAYICRSNKTRQLMWGTDKNARPVTVANLNEYMQSNGFPIFEPVRRQIRVQDGGKTSVLNPAADHGTLVFVPAGNLGIIKNAYSNNELKQEPGVTYSNYGRIRVSQWGAGIASGATNALEYTKAESLCLPVITEFDGIYTLDTTATA